MYSGIQLQREQDAQPHARLLIIHEHSRFFMQLGRSSVNMVKRAEYSGFLQNRKSNHQQEKLEINEY